MKTSSTLNKFVHSTDEEHVARFIEPPSLEKFDSVQLAKEWLSNVSPGDVIGEYQFACDMCCVNYKFMSKTKINSVLEYLESSLFAMPIQDEFNEFAVELIKSTYNIDNADMARKYECPVAKEIIYPSILGVYDSLKWRKVYFQAALRELKDQNSSVLPKVMSDICRGGNSGSLGRKRHAFNKVLEYVENISDEHEVKDHTDRDLDSCKQRIIEVVEYFLDEFKLKAFTTAFIEPSKLYYRSIGRTDHVLFAQVHLSNVWSAILLAVLGVQLPAVPFFDDEEKWGRVRFLRVADSVPSFRQGLDTLWDKRNFGKTIQEIPSLGSIKIPDQVREQEGSFVFTGNLPKDIANEALNESEVNTDQRIECSLYLEKFMQFFQSDFIVELMFNRLNQESSTELQIAFEEYTRLDDSGIPSNDYRYWIWDIQKGNFRVDRACELLQWIGIVDYDPEYETELQRHTSELLPEEMTYLQPGYSQDA